VRTMKESLCEGYLAEGKERKTLSNIVDGDSHGIAQ
jgi:hypothetical protein